MPLNFPNSPGIGSVYTDATSGFSYEWDGTLWKSYSAASSSNIKILDDISGSFNGSTQTFALTSGGISFVPANAQSLIITLGGVTQEPGIDYTVSATNITFTTAPDALLSFSGISLGPAVPLTYANDGNIYIRNTYTGAGTTGPFNFPETYSVGYLDVYRNGVRLSSGSDFVGTSGTNFFLTDAAAVNDEIEAIGYKIASIVNASTNFDNLNVTGITTTGRLQVTTNANIVGVVTASSFVGNLTGNVTGNVTGNLTGTASTATAASTAYGLTGTPNLNVGVVTASSFSGNLTGIATNVKGSAGRVLYNSSTDTTATSGNLTFNGTTLSVNSTPGANTSALSLTGVPFGSSTKNGLLGVGTLGFTDSNLIANFTDDVNSYAQVILQNLNSGNAASADFVVNSDSPLGQTYYGDFGINGTAYNGGGPFGDTSGTYLYSKGGTLSVGTDDAQDFRIATGSAVATPVTRVTVRGTNGNVGIGTTNPTSFLQVVGGDSRFNGVIETVSAATTYMSGGNLVVEMDVRNATTYTYTIPTGANIGIVSFRNMPAETDNASGTTITLITTQNSAGTGNTTATTGIGTNCTVIPFAAGAAVAGISTRALVGSATTVTLSTTGADRDFVSFFIHYTGGTNTAASSYQIYATKNGGFRQGSVGV